MGTSRSAVGANSGTLSQDVNEDFLKEALDAAARSGCTMSRNEALTPIADEADRLGKAAEKKARAENRRILSEGDLKRYKAETAKFIKAKDE